MLFHGQEFLKVKRASSIKIGLCQHINCNKIPAFKTFAYPSKQEHRGGKQYNALKYLYIVHHFSFEQT